VGAKAVTEKTVDIKWRQTGAVELVPVDDAVARVESTFKSLAA
jgi:hypothetical protein